MRGLNPFQLRNRNRTRTYIIYPYVIYDVENAKSKFEYLNIFILFLFFIIKHDFGSESIFSPMWTLILKFYMLRDNALKNYKIKGPMSENAQKYDL